MKFRKIAALLASSLTLTTLSASCTDEDGDVATAGGSGLGGGDSGAVGNAGMGGVGGGSGLLDPAVVVVGQAYMPDDEYLTYVGVYPEVPEGKVAFGQFNEFGNANVSVFDGKIFVEQDGIVQRFSVNEDLQLVEGPRFSWADFGISKANTTSTVFISKTRAYTLAPQADVIVVWDPDAMVRTGDIDLNFPDRPEAMETWANDAQIVGDHVIWNMFSGDWDTPEPHPGVVLAIANKNDDAPPIFIDDSRCLPGGPSFVDKNGDLYVHGGGFFGFFYAYGGIEDGRACALRVSAGELKFDPDYVLDYQEVTGSYVNSPWIRVSEDQYLTRVWDPQQPLPESSDDFWAPEMRSAVLVDQNEGTTVPYPDLEGYDDIDGATRIVDGVSYFQISESGYVAGGSATVVELHPDGIVKKFELSGGFLLGLERLR